MAVFERSSLVRAPLDEVWTFQSSVDGLLAVTPDWFHLRVEAVVAPDGQPDPDELAEGSEVVLSMRPFGVGPRQTWTSHITHRQHTETAAAFRDEMADGPFPRWLHTHRFTAVPDGTRMTDQVVYELPLGPASGLSGLAWPGFAAVFAHRHRETRRQLE